MAGSQKLTGWCIEYIDVTAEVKKLCRFCDTGLGGINLGFDDAGRRIGFLRIGKLGFPGIGKIRDRNPLGDEKNCRHQDQRQQIFPV